MKLTWHTETRKIKDLLPFSSNPRKMSEKQKKDLLKSITKYNLVEIPVINIDNTIIAGHQRINILSSLGKDEQVIDVRIPNRELTASEVREYLLRSNYNHGEWDYDILLSGFSTEELDEVGFSPSELVVGFFEESTEKTSTKKEPSSLTLHFSNKDIMYAVKNAIQNEKSNGELNGETVARMLTIENDTELSSF